MWNLILIIFAYWFFFCFDFCKWELNSKWGSHIGRWLAFTKYREKSTFFTAFSKVSFLSAWIIILPEIINCTRLFAYSAHKVTSVITRFFCLVSYKFPRHFKVLWNCSFQHNCRFVHGNGNFFLFCLEDELLRNWGFISRLSIYHTSCLKYSRNSYQIIEWAIEGIESCWVSMRISWKYQLFHLLLTKLFSGFGLLSLFSKVEMCCGVYPVLLHVFISSISVKVTILLN